MGLMDWFGGKTKKPPMSAFNARNVDIDYNNYAESHKRMASAVKAVAGTTMDGKQAPTTMEGKLPKLRDKKINWDMWKKVAKGTK